MKNLLVVTVALALLLAACAPAVPDPSAGTTEAGTAVVVTVLPDVVETAEIGPIEVGTAIVVTVIPESGGGGTAAPLPTPEPPTAIPSLPASALTPTELKYRVLEEFPDFFFCDPDYYPVARGDEAELALERFPEIQANTEEFQAILNHNGLAGQTSFTDDQKLLIYRVHKKLAAIFFEVVGSQYQFQIRTADQNQQGETIKGLIDGAGNIELQERQPGFVDCPICLAAGTLIDTPNGPVAVEDLKLGDMVWTVDAWGKRISAPILKVGSVPVPINHQMVHIVLEDGREVWASPGHPTADGRVFSDLVVGDLLDGSRIKSVERMPYDQPFTYDLLPSSGTGFYWANGILIGSTLAK
jgi:hypothetical protein